MPTSPLTNFITYLTSPTSQKQRVGHLDFSTNLITPLSFPSGTHLTSLNQVISAGHGTRFIPSSQFDPPIDISSVTLLPPLSGRDVLAVGKNYPEHAKEFNSSGFDSSDMVDIPSHPVIFTKRASSIIASGEEIYPHVGWTDTLDYEGEIGVIIGKEGLGVNQGNAWDFVWGFTIINDITARERQRDHKQFFLGKSADTFCPMGPVAVPITSLPQHESLRIITKVNSELRQDSSLTQLIFPIPSLIATISSAITLQPGDVLATGTPAGVGIGRTPPIYLKPGDTITISVSGLGVLTNKIATADCPLPGIRHIHLPVPNETNLIRLNNSGKLVYISQFGSIYNYDTIVIFIHGLGTSSDLYLPIINAMNLETMKSRLVTYDLEGHGRSPTAPESVVTIKSYSKDLRDLISTLVDLNDIVTLVAYDIGCLVALEYMLSTSAEEVDVVDYVIFVGPVPTTVAKEELYRRAELVREHGMSLGIINVVLKETYFGGHGGIAASYIQTMLAATDPEGYAKGCIALSGMRKYEAGPLYDRLSGKFFMSHITGNPSCLRLLDMRRSFGGQLPEGFGSWAVILQDVQHSAEVLSRGIKNKGYFGIRDNCSRVRSSFPYVIDGSG